MQDKGREESLTGSKRAILCEAGGAGMLAGFGCGGRWWAWSVRGSAVTVWNGGTVGRVMIRSSLREATFAVAGGGQKGIFGDVVRSGDLKKASEQWKELVEKKQRVDPRTVRSYVAQLCQSNRSEEAFAALRGASHLHETLTEDVYHPVLLQYVKRSRIDDIFKLIAHMSETRKPTAMVHSLSEIRESHQILTRIPPRRSHHPDLAHSGPA